MLSRIWEADTVWQVMASGQACRKSEKNSSFDLPSTSESSASEEIRQSPRHVDQHPKLVGDRDKSALAH
jgi:hypothetical protein